ncbi:hypothetical protein LUZ63_001091 [Rhynchospora breviuscula]|uniref:Pectinesterase n=1 Tax=Rhynchospora breviuscula TaxID=2022672 RepID=A0A9Q0CW98_9POAL|nr:hypothetical protein LUZ63_001091 [Rhynchospora breviuscula]
MAKAAIFGGLAAILVVAVVVAVVATVTTSHKSSGGPNLASSLKSGSALCANTLYPETCKKTLSTVVNSSSNPKEVVKASLEVALGELKESYQKALEIGKGVNDSISTGAIANCKELLQDASDDLQAIVKLGNDAVNRQDDLEHWITAVMTFMDNCADGFEDEELKKAMQSVLQKSTEMSSNALAIITAVGNFLKEAGQLFNTTTTNLKEVANFQHRRLLTYDQDAEGYPTWMSVGDRKLLATGAPAKPNVVVAKDGSGNFNSIQATIDAIPKERTGRYVIYVKAGVYDEIVLIPKGVSNIYMYGDGPKKTKVQGHKSNHDGLTTQDTATFSVLGAGFICKNMGFFNTAGAEKHQAVALRLQSDFAAFYNCRMDGYQDTLYVQARRQFFRNCVVSGTIDFIFGNAAAVLQNCLIIVRRPLDNQQNTVTAHGRTDPNMKSGLVIQNCRIVPEKAMFADRFKIPNYLARPWKMYSRTVIMESTIGDFIRPEGYLPWDGDFALKTLYYAEYANRGPGAVTKGRVKWPGFHVIGRKEAEQFTTQNFINGHLWLKYTGTPHFLGFKP